MKVIQAVVTAANGIRLFIINTLSKGYKLTAIHRSVKTVMKSDSYRRDSPEIL